MTYRPTEAVFGPPLSVRIPSILYLAIALLVAVIVVAGEMSPPDTWLNDYVVQRDVHRIISSRTLAMVLVASSIASLVRAGMRGVRIRGDGVEYRDVVTLLPKVRRFKWAQIDQIILDSPKTITLDLWDGTRAFLPIVSDRIGLARALEKVAAARAIPVRGGAGLDEIPDSSEFDSETDSS
jgi:hypothetical protein